MSDNRYDLIDAYLDGTLTSEEGESLQALLKADSEARKTLRRRATIDECLSDLAQGGMQLITPSAQVIRPSIWKTVLPWGVAAILAFVLLSDRWLDSDSSESKTETFLGLLVNEAGAEFETGFGPSDVKFDSGEYRLQKGAIHLRFVNGADIIMKSPAVFHIEDSFHLALRSGGLRAIIPPSAEGFTVATPGIDYEDLGTEFGVSVNPTSGSSQLHVFDGQVDARLAETSQLLLSVFRGETMEYSNGQLNPGIAPAFGTYPQPGEIGFIRWQKWQQEFVKDQGLIGYYSFTEGEDRSLELVNELDRSAVSNGAIHQARWVSGRWPGKQALLFDDDKDFVEFDLPGEFEELTISAWIKVNRFDHELTAIFDSNAWEDGGVHFQFSRNGVVETGAKGLASTRSRNYENDIKTNSWQHVVSISSRLNKTLSVYLDGELAMKSDITKDGPIIPGTCRLGNWLKDPNWENALIRAFKGRMDELAIWNRALEESEIRKHYEAGRPNLLDD